MAISPSAISALSRILTRVDDVTGPKEAAVHTITGIIKARAEIGLEIHEVYGAVADGCGLSAAGITAKYQSYLHRYLTDIGAMVFNLVGAYLVIDWIKEKGIAFLKTVGNALIAMLPVPMQMGIRTAWAGAKLALGLKDEDGNVAIARDESGLANLPPAAIGNVFETIMTSALPLGLWGIVGTVLQPATASASTGSIRASAPSTPGMINVPSGMQIPTIGGGVINTVAPALSLSQTLKQTGAAALSQLVGNVVGKIGGLLGIGDEARDEDIDRIIYQEAVRGGCDPEVLKAAVNQYLSQQADSDLGYGFTLPDVDQDTR